MSRIKVLSLLLALSLVLTSCSGHKAKTQELFTGSSLYSDSLPSSGYNTTKVVRGDFIKGQTYYATVYLPIQKKLTFKSEGQQVTFLENLVDQNEKVKKDTPLVNFNLGYDEVKLAEMKLKLERAEADYQTNLAAYEKAVSDAQADYNSMKDGYEKDTAGIVLKKKKLEYDQYKYDSEEKIEQLKKDLSDYESKIAVSQLYAPFDGVMVFLNDTKKDGDTVEQPEDTVKPEDILAILASEDVVQFQVNDKRNELRYNMEVSIEFTYEGDEYNLKGRVVSDLSVLSGTSGNSLVTIEAMDEPEKDINWLELKQITVTVDTVFMKDVLIVDSGAVYIDEGIAFVKVLDGEVIHSRNVIVADNNKKNYWILQGLEEGQTLILK